MYFTNETDPVLSVLEDMFMKYKVDLALWGHVHNAQVTCPVFKGKCVPEKTPGVWAAPIHAVIGNGGNQITEFPPEESQWASWSVYQSTEWGHAYITASNATHMHMEFFVNDPN